MSSSEMPTVMIGQIVNIKIRKVNLLKINAPHALLGGII